ncbi:DUF2237 domain-containing protein, partial [Edaphobacter sp.]|uniref:DUF2237 family protein n=1 Tax=Edaphobacter sp. TaxID=1934404 RepID=UPI002DBD02E0
MPATEPTKAPSRNVLGQPLATCGCGPANPTTGFYRDNCCNTGPDDLGVHTICCIVDAPFLEASKVLGNDLSTPRPEFGFDGLKPGDRWCVCAARWLQVHQAGAACPVVLEATHEATLQIVPFEILIQYAVIPDMLH